MSTMAPLMGNQTVYNMQIRSIPRNQLDIKSDNFVISISIFKFNCTLRVAVKQIPLESITDGRNGMVLSTIRPVSGSVTCQCICITMDPTPQSPKRLKMTFSASECHFLSIILTSMHTVERTSNPTHPKSMVAMDLYQ